ncbi:MAG: hypothetical protein NXY57DRAFT_1029587 [Lentinula lateritia]|nr:MAG: hypothetical protein NXY57DRAFT_1029587 [Lentinula lateritia]
MVDSSISLPGSTDSRADESHRRIILSRYLMRVNEAGEDPPQEVMYFSCYINVH